MRWKREKFSFFWGVGLGVEMKPFSASHPVTELAELSWLTSTAPIDSVSKVNDLG
jgi:hypothetical protein